MPKLDERLKSVAKLIRSNVHADIGSDHGHLLAALLKAGRIERGIAIENKRQPFANSKATLSGLNAEVRFADGLAGLNDNEAESLSLCGMGAETIVRILCEFPSRVTRTVVVQPNTKPELVRGWALQNSFHLVGEKTTPGIRSFIVMRFDHCESAVDPAYDNVDLGAAMLFGPLVLKARERSFIDRLQRERAYLQGLQRLSEDSKHRLATIESILDPA